MAYLATKLTYYVCKLNYNSNNLNISEQHLIIDWTNRLAETIMKKHIGKINLRLEKIIPMSALENIIDVISSFYKQSVD